ncbi:EFR1 family ferrodoxin [Desulfoluna sp.]|uniref:EFR1 family ferrodoxin n=1 Tax=Desulfoluna sp. TaxID=2045199 RepID=UPI002623C871|nr:EFR1 family ferrodoxin [Desulfoluna sp.]
MKTALIFFSATENTARMARVIRHRLERSGVDVDEFDITAWSDRQKQLDLAPYHTLVFGFPVHSLRAPRVTREWLRTLNGGGKKCALFFTFGGFTVHPAHQTTREILREQHFSVVASAEFPGAHTFNHGGWRALADRPNAADDALAEEFADRVLKRFTGEDPAILGELDPGIYSAEELDRFEGFRFRMVTQIPTRAGAPCSLCGLCEEICPTQAMDATSGTADPEKCIACLRCLASCPEQALTINDMSASWTPKLNLGKTTEDALNAQQGTLYL